MLHSITNSTDKNLSKLQEIVEDRGAWHAAVHAAAKVRHNLVAEQQQQRRPHVRRGKGGMRWGEKEHARLSRVAGLSPPTRQPPREAGAASACSDKDKEGGGELLGPTQVVPAERAREMRVPCSRRPVLGTGGSGFMLPMVCTHPPHTPSPIGVPGRHGSLGDQEGEF